MDFGRRRLLSCGDWTEERHRLIPTVRLQTVSSYTSPQFMIVLLLVTTVTFISAETVSNVCRQKCYTLEVSYVAAAVRCVKPYTKILAPLASFLIHVGLNMSYKKLSGTLRLNENFRKLRQRCKLRQSPLRSEKYRSTKVANCDSGAVLVPVIIFQPLSIIQIVKLRISV